MVNLWVGFGVIQTLTACLNIHTAIVLTVVAVPCENLGNQSQSVY